AGPAGGGLGSVPRGKAAGRRAAPPMNTQTPPATAKERPAVREAAKPEPVSALEETGDAVTLSSRVLGPDGKPFAGAEVTVWWYMHCDGYWAWHNSTMRTVAPHFGATRPADGRLRLAA